MNAIITFINRLLWAIQRNNQRTGRNPRKRDKERSEWRSGGQWGV